MKKQNIFFDLDGTLTDSMPGITRAVQYALRHYGIQVDDLELLKPFVGPPLPESFREYYNFSREAANEAVLVFREYYQAKGWLENEPFPGVKEMLEEVRKSGRTLYVATSKPEEIARQVLAHFGMTEYFAFIGGACDDNNRARKDEVIRYVMEENGIRDRESVVMVGDRRHDVEGAHKEGIQAIGILYGYGSREELLKAGAEWIEETPASLAKLIKTL